MDTHLRSKPGEVLKAIACPSMNSAGRNRGASNGGRVASGSPGGGGHIEDRTREPPARGGDPVPRPAYDPAEIEALACQQPGSSNSGRTEKGQPPPSMGAVERGGRGGSTAREQRAAAPLPTDGSAEKRRNKSQKPQQNTERKRKANGDAGRPPEGAAMATDGSGSGGAGSTRDQALPGRRRRTDWHGQKRQLELQLEEEVG